MGRIAAFLTLACVLLGFALIANIVQAALIHGTIYDLALDQESDVRVRINTIPQQFLIAKNGDYSFDVPKGDYVITAYTRDSYAQENISIEDETGNYTIDIILEPSIDTPLTIDTNFSDVSSDIPNEKNTVVWRSVFIILLLLGVIIGVYLLSKKYIKNKTTTPILKTEIEFTDIAQQDMYGKNVLQFIKKHTRTTQKELRKNIPLSEGKISLIVSELETDGKIRKIKKGRGNILIFVKE
jgi:uncharacterized membrane protein